MVAHILLVIGGLNWLLTAFEMNVVELVFGAWPAVVTVIYVLVGLSAVYELLTHKGRCTTCSA
jgi:hypothetical protein